MHAGALCWPLYESWYLGHTLAALSVRTGMADAGADDLQAGLALGQTHTSRKTKGKIEVSEEKSF